MAVFIKAKVSPMPLSDLSESTQNYLKTIWGLTEWSDEPVTTSRIAEKTGLRLSSVSDALKRLSKAGLVVHQPYSAIELTAEGRTYAVEMVRRHRLIETFLVETLGYGWDQVHDEAEVLEHSVSDKFIAHIDELLGNPIKDPHGDPIPTASGVFNGTDAHTLLHCPVGSKVKVERIDDDDADLLRFFADRKVAPGAVLTVKEPEPFSDSLSVEADGQLMTLGRYAAAALFVSGCED